MADKQKIWHYNQPGQRVIYDLKAFLLMVQRGQIEGATYFGAYGKYIATGAVSNRGIWSGPTQFQPYDLVGVSDGYLISTSAQDAPGGSGVEAFECHYIESGTGNQEHETIIMNGLTPVPIPFNFRFIQCLHSIKGQFTAGNISLIGNTGTVTYSYVPAGSVRCASAFRMIPSGYTFYIADLLGGGVSGTAAAQVELEYISTEIDGHQYVEDGLYIPHNTILTQDASHIYTGNSVARVNSGQICSIWGSTDKGAKMAVSYVGWLEREADAVEIY